MSRHKVDLKPAHLETGYMIQLDALRGMAVFAVMLHHFMPSIAHVLPNDFINLGNAAVRLFFVLSGFLITRILLNAKQKMSVALPGSFLIQRFYLRRTLRIFPIYYLTLGVASLLNIPGSLSMFGWHFFYLSNVYYSLQGSFEGQLSHFWSLSVEEQFYLLFPWLIFALSKQWIGVGLLLLILSSPLFRMVVFATSDSPLGAALLLPACLDSLGLGALLAHYSLGPKNSYHRFAQSCGWIGAGTIAFLAICYTNHQFPLLVNSLTQLATSLLFTVLIAKTAEGFQGWMKSVMEWQPLLSLGKISYGAYLYHPLVLFGVNTLAKRLYDFPSNAIGIELGLACVAIALTWLLAHFSWVLLEQRIQALKVYFPIG